MQETKRNKQLRFDSNKPGTRIVSFYPNQGMRKETYVVQANGQLRRSVNK